MQDFLICFFVVGSVVIVALGYLGASAEQGYRHVETLLRVQNTADPVWLNLLTGAVGLVLTYLVAAAAWFVWGLIA
jgi:hypothetical protein